MAESSDEKTEHATPRRLREARKKGQVPKSRDVSMILISIVIFVTFALMMGRLSGDFQVYFRRCFEAISAPVLEWSTIYDLGKAGAWTIAKALIPVFVGATVVAFLSTYIQVGSLFTAEPLTPKPERLNPIEGIKNMFKIVTFIELIKNIVKILIVFYIAYSTLKKYIGDILLMSTVDMFTAASLTGGIIFEFFMKVAVCFVIIAVADYALQRWNFMKNMKMSKDEVKREYKQDEGDPQVKGERRRLHREMAMGDVRKAVKKADVVVSNPIHVACVIEYDRKEMGAPTLTAKGQRLFAEAIIEMAREENIPVVRNIPLAWSLVHLEIGDEVPEDLYETVAEVLTVVYEMKQKKDEPNPAPPQNVPPTQKGIFG